jgi:DMSO/TMAO reductase YedYZ molybdopterin-dependent catalytic subunit
MTMSEARFGAGQPDGIPPGARPADAAPPDIVTPEAASPETAPPDAAPPVLSPPSDDADSGAPDGAGSGAPGPDRPTRSTAAAALDGILSGAVALGVATLLAAVMRWLAYAGGTPSPIPAVGAAFVDRTPPWLKDFAVSTFGTNDKLALFVGMGVVLVTVCAGIGLVSRTRSTLAVVLLCLMGALGAAAVLSRPGALPQDIAPTVIGALLGIRALGQLGQASWASDGNVPRRRFLAGGGAAVAALVGSWLSGVSGQAAEARAQVALPAAGPAPGLAGASLDVPGLSPYVVPNAAFYRIDTALVVPRLDTAAWSLKVVGEVEHEVTLDWATLLSKPMQQALVTLTCVSNEVGGDLVGNAVWTGWPVRELLALAGPKPGADMVLSRSSDGFTAGTPIEALTDDRNALVAIGMNGEPLPFEHGFPVRLVVPGLYGYVSATKWLTELKVTRFSADQGYWTPRGWSARGPIKTASRIDVPRSGARLKAGPIAVAGVAWAQHRGIKSVEVRVDEGPWQAARLAGEPTTDAWRQWVYEWVATAGQHSIRVRATDGTGAVQPAQESPPAPDGSSGYHRVDVTVE